MNGNNVIVSGGSGFLGSHLVDALPEAGAKVTIFDHKEPSLRSTAVKVVTGDIMDEEKVAPLLTKTDYVYNVAGMADIQDCNTRCRYLCVSNLGAR